MTTDFLARFREADRQIAYSVALYDEANAARERGRHAKADRLQAKSHRIHDKGWKLRNETKAAFDADFAARYPNVRTV